jgi:hypothetical protein
MMPFGVKSLDWRNASGNVNIRPAPSNANDNFSKTVVVGQKPFCVSITVTTVFFHKRRIREFIAAIHFLQAYCELKCKVFAYTMDALSFWRLAMTRGVAVSRRGTTSDVAWGGWAAAKYRRKTSYHQKGCLFAYI